MSSALEKEMKGTSQAIEPEVAGFRVAIVTCSTVAGQHESDSMGGLSTKSKGVSFWPKHYGLDGKL